MGKGIVHPYHSKLMQRIWNRSILKHVHDYQLQERFCAGIWIRACHDKEIMEYEGNGYARKLSPDEYEKIRKHSGSIVQFFDLGIIYGYWIKLYRDLYHYSLHIDWLVRQESRWVDLTLRSNTKLKYVSRPIHSEKQVIRESDCVKSILKRDGSVICHGLTKLFCHMTQIIRCSFAIPNVA